MIKIAMANLFIFMKQFLLHKQSGKQLLLSLDDDQHHSIFSRVFVSHQFISLLNMTFHYLIGNYQWLQENGKSLK